MRTRVKICGITRHEDAAAAVAAGADALGFILWPKSARYVTPERMAELAARVPPLVGTVAVFVNPSVEEVQAVLRACPTATLQFHGEESPAFCAQFARPWIKAAGAREGFDLRQYLAAFGAASAWLIDAFHDKLYGGTGQSFDWSMVPAQLARPMVLSGGLDARNAAAAIEHLHPYALDVSSGVERDKGIKDPEKIRAFMAAVRDADHRLAHGASLEQA